MKKRQIKKQGFGDAGFFFLLIFFLVAATLSASEFRANDNVNISTHEVISDDLYVFGNGVDINGDIEGDLVSFCYDLSSTGAIDGSANIFSYNADLIGRVGGSTRIFSYMVRINCPIEGNLVVLGGNVRIGENAVVLRDLNFNADKITMDGTVHGDIDGHGGEIIIGGTGKIDGNVKIAAKRILVVAPAVIKGSFTYTSPEEAIIDPGVVIQGEIKRELPKPDEESEKDAISIFGAIFKILLFVMSVVTGLVLILLLKVHTLEAVTQIETRFWFTLAVGCLAIMILIGGAIVSVAMIIGIPLALVMFSLGLILFYIGKIYSSIALGRFLLGRLNRERKPGLIAEFLLGLVLLAIVFQIPYLGWLAYIAAFIIGTGAIVVAFMSIGKRLKTATATEASAIS